MASRPGPLTISPASLARRPGSLTRKKRTLVGKKFPLAGKIFLVARGRIRALARSAGVFACEFWPRQVGAPPQDGASHDLSPLNEPGWALNVFWLPVSGRRACAVRGRKSEHGSPSPSPGPDGPRWIQMGD